MFTSAGASSTEIEYGDYQQNQDSGFRVHRFPDPVKLAYHRAEAGARRLMLRGIESMWRQLQKLVVTEKLFLVLWTQVISKSDQDNRHMLQMC